MTLKDHMYSSGKIKQGKAQISAIDCVYHPLLYLHFCVAIDKQLMKFYYIAKEYQLYR